MAAVELAVVVGSALLIWLLVYCLLATQRVQPDKYLACTPTVASITDCKLVIQLKATWYFRH